MKLQIAFDLVDLDQALNIATQVSDYADIIEVGSLLIFKNGDLAVRTFKEKFPQKVILADTKIVDRGKETVHLFAQSGADWITVMAGTNKHIIHSVTQRAKELGKRVVLDLLDSGSLGQSALEAQSLGVNALLFHCYTTDNNPALLLEQWDMVKGNTTLPIFIAATVTKETVHDVIAFNPAGIVLGSVITGAKNPQEEAAYFYDLVHKGEE